jgi:hypothetical protein
VDDVERQIASVTRDLQSEFAQRVPPEAVERLVSESFQAYERSRIRTFLPILVRREARSRLRRIAAPERS